MSAFVDTSAFVALLISGDKNHSSARNAWSILRARNEALVTTDYVILETCAVIHKRFGVEPVRRFVEDIIPAILTEWVDVNTQLAGVSGVLMSGRRGPNMVDCVSFAAMRKLNIRSAFTFDPHFRQQGFTIMPKAA